MRINVRKGILCGMVMDYKLVFCVIIFLNRKINNIIIFIIIDFGLVFFCI